MWRILSGWLRAVLIALTLFSLWRGILPYAVQGLLAVMMAFLVTAALGRKAPAATFWAHQGLFLHTGGNVLGWYNEYEGVYDKIAHGVGTFAAVAVGHALVPRAHWETARWRAFLLVLIGMAAGTLWEISEFAVDQLHARMAGWIDVGRRMQPSLDDTMWDLVMDAAMALVAGLVLALGPSPGGGSMKRELLFGSAVHVREGAWGTLNGLIIDGRCVTHLVVAPDAWNNQMAAIPMERLEGVGPDNALYLDLHRGQVTPMAQERPLEWSMGNQAVTVILLDPALFPVPEPDTLPKGALLLNGKFDVEGQDGPLGQVMGARMDDGALTHIALRSGWPLTKEVFIPVEAIAEWQPQGLKTHLSQGGLERLSRP